VGKKNSELHQGTSGVHGVKYVEYKVWPWENIWKRPSNDHKLGSEIDVPTC